MSIKKRHLTFAAALYLYSEVFIFILGWLAWPVAVACTALTAAALWFFWRDIRHDEGECHISCATLATLTILLVALCVVCGQGAFVGQDGDWEKHNAVFRDLTLRPWPVFYDNGQERAMLGYYIGTYLPPALIGKLFGSYRVAELAMLGWSALCLMLTHLMVAAWLSMRKWWHHALVALVLFGFTGTSMLTDWLSWFGYDFPFKVTASAGRFIGKFSQTYTQFLPPLLASTMLVSQRGRLRNYVVIAMPMVLTAVLSLVGMAMLMVIDVVIGLRRQGWWRQLADALRQACSWQNILVVAGCGVVTVIYLYANATQAKPEEYTGLCCWLPYITQPWYWRDYVIVLLGGMAATVVPIWLMDGRMPRLVIVSVLTVMPLPLFKYGTSGDWWWRTPTVPFIVLSILLLRSIVQTFTAPTAKRWRLVVAWAMVVNIALCTKHSYNYLEENAWAYGKGFTLDGSNRRGEIYSIEEWSYRDGSVASTEAYNYSVYDYENTLFYKICRK